MEKIKMLMPAIVLLNLLITLLVFITNKEGETVIITTSRQNNRSELKELVCRGAFKEIQDHKYSNYYLHPDLIKGINEDSSQDYELHSDDKFYFSFVARQICKVVVRKQSGFIAFEAIISESGPLSFQVTSLRPIKPTYKEIKRYL